jgi:hypothetical protein
MLAGFRTDEQPSRGATEVVISVRREPGATVISATGSVDIALLADLANAARLVSTDGPVILDLSHVDFLDPAGAALADMWSKTGIDHGAVAVTNVRLTAAGDTWTLTPPARLKSEADPAT